VSEIGDMRRLGELHVAEAKKYALRICSFAAAVFPAEWGKEIVEDCTLTVLLFAYHARRVNDLAGLAEQEFGSVDCLIVRIDEGDPGQWETNYQFALNALHHASGFAFGWSQSGHRQIYLQSSANLIPTYVRVETDRFAAKTISLIGVANCFLSEVIELLRLKCPNWQL
jgi:hypothetical protein